MGRFQLILLVVFGFFIVVAVMAFALYKGGSGSNLARIVIWGDIPTQELSLVLNDPSFSQDKNITVSYVEKPKATIESDFTEALASGGGPDLIILTQDQFWKNRNKLVAIPYKSISQKDYQDAFIEASEIFLTPDGIYGLPLSIDPLVLFYNRDLLSAAGLARPLEFWDEIFKQTSSLTQRDQAGNIVRSTIALGETKNISNFKDILSLLLLQSGSSITGFAGSYLRSTLADNSQGLAIRPGEAALEFYTQFANPTKSYYSWNRTLPEAQTRFASGDAAYYIGYASELRALRNKNPTLNVGVAPVPQSRVSEKVITTGKLHAVAISRGTRNATAALTTALRLVSAQSAGILARNSQTPPARRDLLSERPTDAILPVYWNSALQAKSWIDPDAEASSKIFRDAIDAVVSGRARVSEGVNSAHEQIQSLIEK